MRLSPLDPLHYAMLGTRALSHMTLGEDAVAAEWADRAASSPGAHVLIAMIATAAHALAGNDGRAATGLPTFASATRCCPTKIFSERFRCSRPTRGRASSAR